MSSEYFDNWYSDISSHPDARDAFVSRFLGLPPELKSTSLLTLAGLRETRDLLELSPASVLLDLACGRGGYGMWLARETGARLIGVDFSAVAVQQAADRVGAFGLNGRAAFQIGELEATELPDRSIDAVLCVDAIQFADEIAAAAGEIRRILVPGGRAVITTWEPHDPNDERLPERLRRVRLDEQLRAGGLADVRIQEKPEWMAVEQRMWQAALEIDPRDDPALASLKSEAERVVPAFGATRRILAVATGN